MTETKIFISGPITNVPDYKERFNKAEEELRKMGYKSIMNPSVLPSEGFDYEDYMTITITMMRCCDAVVFIDGWRLSTGAQTEHVFAVNKGMKLLYGLEEARKFLSEIQ